MNVFRTIIAIVLLLVLLLLAAVTPIVNGTIDTIQDKENLIFATVESKLFTNSDNATILFDEKEDWENSLLANKYETWAGGDFLEEFSIEIIEGLYNWVESDRELYIEIDVNDLVEKKVAPAIDSELAAYEQSSLPSCTAIQNSTYNQLFAEKSYGNAYEIDLASFECKYQLSDSQKVMYKSDVLKFFKGVSDNSEGSETADNSTIIIDSKLVELSNEDLSAIQAFYGFLGNIKWVLLAILVGLAALIIVIMPNRMYGFYAVAGCIAFASLNYIPTLFTTREMLQFTPNPTEPAEAVITPFFEEYFYFIVRDMRIYTLIQFALSAAFVAAGVLMGKAAKSQPTMIQSPEVAPATEAKEFGKA